MAAADAADGLALKTSAEAEWNGPTMVEKFERSPPPSVPLSLLVLNHDVLGGGVKRDAPAPWN